MNTPSPLVPQGTTPAKGKVSFFVKVLMILTVHVVVIGGCLLAGCKDTKDSTPPPADTAAAPSADTLPPANPGMSNAMSNASTAAAPLPNPGQPSQSPGQPAPVTQTQVAPPTLQPVQPVPPPVIQPVAAPSGDAKEYVIASGDTLGALAKKNGVSLKALLAANAGVDPKKLKVGQKIQIPAGSGSTPAATASGTGMAADAGSADGTTYVVKAGDTLGKIAKQNHTSYKKIMALNDMKTTAIKAGQKLKMPAPHSSEAPAAPVSTSTPVSSPPPLAAPTGVTVSNQ